MGNRGPRFSAAEIALLLGLAAWASFPLVLLLVHAVGTHTTLTGADGLIGADGVLGADQLQYLAWARDAGSHGLASDLFTLGPNGHVYLEPLFTITGALGRLGLSLPLAYLLWKPVGILALWLAGVAWARRAFADAPGPRTAAGILAIFLYTPLTALFSWTGVGPGPFRFQLYLLGDELLGAEKLWGYVPSAIALALIPAALLSAERALDPDRGGRPGRRRLSRQVGRGPLLTASGAALLASWLHPWQGITLIFILAGLGIWQREEGGLSLLVPVLGAGLPLAYYFWLGHSDPAWQLAAHYEVIPRLEPLALVAGFGPLFLLAAFGLRDPRESVFEQILVLWILACFVTYFSNNAFAPHALQGLSFPLAVLAVRGWRRLRLPVALAAVALVLVTAPGLAYDGRKFVRTSAGSHVQYYLPRSDTRALNWIGRAPRGGVLAPTPIALTVPAQTGHAVWVGHSYWTPSYLRRRAEALALFRGHLRSAEARHFVIGTGVAFLLSDCSHRHDLSATLGRLITSVHRFGCARVYVLALRRSATR